MREKCGAEAGTLNGQILYCGYAKATCGLHRNPQDSTVQGTVWTEPGQGATVAELDAAILDWVRASERALDRLIWRKQDLDVGTNLRLTGAPLTAEDIKRISEAK